MQFLLNLILDFLPIKYWKIAGIVAIFLAGAFSGYKLTSWYYQEDITDLKSEISTLEVNIKQYETAYLELSRLTAKQNEAVIDLERKQLAKTKEIEIAQKAARNASKALYDDASTLLRKTSNNATNACLEASKLIDEELSKERLK